MRTKTILLVSLSVLAAVGLGWLIVGRASRTASLSQRPTVGWASRPSAVGSVTIPVAVVGGAGLPAEAGISPIAVLPSTASIPPRVRAIVGIEGDGRLGTRLWALDLLGGAMSAEEQRAICRFLLDRAQRGQRLSPDQQYVMINDVLKALRLQEQPLPELTDVMLALYHDPGEYVVVRDYALQTLGEWYEQAPDRQRIVPVLWEATSETDSTIAGTALLALFSISGGSGSTPTAASAPSQSTTEIDRASLAQAALRLAADERCGVAARVTALQMCARLDVREAGAVARQLAETADVVSLRVSAIAALGAVGGADSMEFLKQLAAGPDVRLQPAARAALQRVRSRLGGQA